MILILREAPESSTTYLGALFDIWSLQDPVTGTYQLLPPADWRADPRHAMSLEVLSRSSCAAIWTLQSGTMAVTLGGDSVRGEINGMIKKIRSYCGGAEPDQSSLHINFSYARHWWQR